MPNDFLSTDQQPDTIELSSVMVVLLKGVLYQDVDTKHWANLLLLQHQVRDYVSVLGLMLELDEAEGYAYLHTRREDLESDEQTDNEPVPKLIPRRQLSFSVSLLLALLRKKLAEFDASGGDTRLVLSRENIAELMQLFLPDSSNEAKVMDQIDRHINKVIELGFLRRLKNQQHSGSTQALKSGNFEVRRIIKAFIDAQWLAEFDQKLSEYQQQLQGKDSD